MKATKRLIDSVWTLEYEIINENEIKVLNYNRTDSEGYDNEANLPQCVLIEDEERTIVEVLIRDKFESFDWVNRENCDHVYKVVNPQHVFTYKN